MYASPVRSNGRNGLAALAGVGAMFVGALVWTVIAIATKHDYRIVAMLVGAVVGGGMYLAGPSKRSMAWLAGLLAFLGCAIGWFFVVGWLASHDSGISMASMLKLEARNPRELYWSSMNAERYFYWLSGAAVAAIITLRRAVQVGQTAPRAHAIAPSFGGPAYGNPGHPAPQGYAGPPQGYAGPPQGYPAPQGYAGPPQGRPGPPGYGPPPAGPGYGRPQYPPFQG